MTSTDRSQDVEILATYVDRDILQSGWLLGEQVIARKAAAVSVKHGQGKVVLIGFRPQHRAQTHGTFKLVFNALLNGPSGAPAPAHDHGAATVAATLGGVKRWLRILQDLRYALRTLNRSRRADARHRRVARDRHRRQHGHLQRRQRAAAEAAAVSRSRPPRRALAAVARASTSRRTGRRPGSTSTSSTENQSFDEMSISQGRSGTLLGRDQPERVEGAADLVEPVPSARRQAAVRPAAAARGRRPGQAAGRRPEPRVLAARSFGADPEHRRQEHHAQRRGRRRWRGQEPVQGRRRAPARVPAERRDHADGREHPADGHVPAAAARRRRRQRAAATRTTTSWRA